jgi:hypothetical protein
LRTDIHNGPIIAEDFQIKMVARVEHTRMFYALERGTSRNNIIQSYGEGQMTFCEAPLVDLYRVPPTSSKPVLRRRRNDKELQTEVVTLCANVDFLAVCYHIPERKDLGQRLCIYSVYGSKPLLEFIPISYVFSMALTHDNILYSSNCSETKIVTYVLPIRTTDLTDSDAQVLATTFNCPDLMVTERYVFYY